MNTLFEIAGECKHLSDAELIYNITNSRESASRYDETLKRNERFSMESLFEELTPGRKRVAIAAVEMYKRTMEREYANVPIRSSQDIYNIMAPLLCGLPNEEFWLILLDQSLNVKRKTRLSVGGIAGTYVDIRLLMKQVIVNNAVSVALVHNHPSGQLTPSVNDTGLTRKIKTALEYTDITLTDHVIISNKGYYSFTDEGNI